MMKISSNVPISEELIARIVGRFTGSFFVPAAFPWRDLSVAIETAGPGDGFGICAFYYAENGKWEGARETSDVGSVDDIYVWIAETYDAVGSWRECLLQIRRTDDGFLAHSEFEYKDVARWRLATHVDDLPEIMRPPVTM